MHIVAHISQKHIKTLKTLYSVHTRMNFQELFEVTYTGSISDLTDKILQIDGVQNARTTEPSHRSVDDKTIEYTITYDPELTDRTLISTTVEQFPAVSGSVTHV